MNECELTKDYRLYYYEVNSLIKRAGLDKYSPRQIAILIDKYINASNEEKMQLYTEEERAYYEILSNLSVFPEDRYNIIFSAMSNNQSVIKHIRGEKTMSDENIFMQTRKIRDIIHIIEKLEIQNKSEKEIYRILTKHTKLVKKDDSMKTQMQAQNYLYVLDWLRGFSKQEGINIIIFALSVMKKTTSEPLEENNSEDIGERERDEVIWSLGRQEGYCLAQKDMYLKVLEKKQDISIDDLNDITEEIKELEKTISKLQEYKKKNLSKRKENDEKIIH